MKNSNYKARCYESHPPLPMGGDLVIYGGSCAHPVVLDADIYVGFDFSMQRSEKMYPWVEGESFLYPITDMRAPNDPKSFAKFIDWLAVQLTAKKKIHLGCIGGHGRTGTVLAALVAKVMGRKDAIQYVRDNYCQKAVESQEQIDFLMEHFGVSSASPTKGHGFVVGSGAGAATSSWLASPRATKAKPQSKPSGQGSLLPDAPAGQAKALPTKSPLSIWGVEAIFDKPGKPVNMAA